MNTAHWIYTGETKFFFHLYTCSNCGSMESEGESNADE